MLEAPTKPINRVEILSALKSLEDAGDPLVRFRIKFRTLHRYPHTGPYGAKYSAHIFRPPGTGAFLRREGSASEILRKFILSDNGVRDDIHPRQGEVIQAVRIYTSGPMGIPVDHLRYPPKQ